MLRWLVLQKAFYSPNFDSLLLWSSISYCVFDHFLGQGKHGSWCLPCTGSAWISWNTSYYFRHNHLKNSAINFDSTFSLWQSFTSITKFRLKPTCVGESVLELYIISSALDYNCDYFSQICNTNRFCFGGLKMFKNYLTTKLLVNPQPKIPASGKIEDNSQKSR